MFIPNHDSYFCVTFFEAVLPENQFHAEKFKSTVMAAPTMLQEVIF